MGRNTNCPGDVKSVNVSFVGGAGESVIHQAAGIIVDLEVYQ